MEHPIVTAASELGVEPGVVANYSMEGRRDTTWYVEGVIKYHRQVSTIVNAVIDAGFVLRRVLEPVPSPSALHERPDLERHRHHPRILVLAATAPGK